MWVRAGALYNHIEVENEEGREAEAAGCYRFLATITRKYDSTHPRSRR